MRRRKTGHIVHECDVVRIGILRHTFVSFSTRCVAWKISVHSSWEDMPQELHNHQHPQQNSPGMMRNGSHARVHEMALTKSFHGYEK